MVEVTTDLLDRRERELQSELDSIMGALREIGFWRLMLEVASSEVLEVVEKDELNDCQQETDGEVI
jgi:hypothetical protein